MRVRGVGVDIASVPRIARLVAASPSGSRWFTEAEHGRCRRSANPPRAYAEAFAAKEAVWKAIAVPSWDDSVPWRWVDTAQIGTAQLGGPVAAALSAAGAVLRIQVSTSSTDAVATAFATAFESVTPR